MQANKPYISTGVRHIFAIISSQISTMMEPVNAILKHEPANRRLEISPRDISFLSSLSIIHAATQATSEKRAQKFHTDDAHYPVLDSASDWL